MFTKKIFAQVALSFLLAVLLASCGLHPDPDRALENAGVSLATVTFNANGAASGNVPEAITTRVGRSIQLPSGQGLTARFTGRDYQFDGWNTRADGTGTSHSAWQSGGQWAGPSFTVTGNVTLYAQWVPSQTLRVTGIPSGNNGRFLHFDNESSSNRIIGAASVTGTQASPTVTGVAISGTTVDLPMWRFTNGEWQRFSGSHSVSGRLKITNGSTGTAGHPLSGEWTLHEERRLDSISLINGSGMVSWPQQ